MMIAAVPINLLDSGVDVGVIEGGDADVDTFDLGGVDSAVATRAIRF